MKKKKIFVHYVDGCSPKMKTFTDKNKMYKFVAEFQTKHEQNPDNWVDFVFEGEILLESENYRYDQSN